MHKDLETLANWLDAKFEGPFGFRFGLDGLIGLIPGVGDLTTNILSIYIIGRAAQEGYPPSVIARMIMNVLFENVLDTVPLLGNVADIFWKSNLKNIRLLENYEKTPAQTKRRSALIVFALLLFVFLAMTAIVALSVWLLMMLMQLIF